MWLGGHWEGQAEAALQVEQRKGAHPREARAQRQPAGGRAAPHRGRGPERDRDRERAATHRPGWAKRYSAATTSAISYLSQATRLQPDNALAWYLLGSFRLAEGCPYAALPAFNSATVYDGKNPAYADAYATTLLRVNSGKEKC